MPISYDNAFGGIDDTHENPSKHKACSSNPVGVGFHSNLENELAKADIVLTPDVGTHKTFDFSNIEYLIEVGRQAALEIIPQIRNAMMLENKHRGVVFHLKEMKCTN